MKEALRWLCRVTVYTLYRVLYDKFNRHGRASRISELYLSCFFLIGLLTLVCAQYVRGEWVVTGVLIICFYRSWEIFVFSLKWMFVDEGPVISYRRSLAFLLLNLVEVVILFAASYLAVGFVDGLMSAIYASLRISATVGPQSGFPDDGALAQVLIAWQIAVSVFLIIVAIAHVVGGVGRRS